MKDNGKKPRQKAMAKNQIKNNWKKNCNKKLEQNM